MGAESQSERCTCRRLPKIAKINVRDMHMEIKPKSCYEKTIEDIASINRFPSTHSVEDIVRIQVGTKFVFLIGKISTHVYAKESSILTICFVLFYCWFYKLIKN